MRRQMFAFVFVALPLAAVALPRGFAACRAAQSATPRASASGLDLAAMDRMRRACTDFYQFACGGWVARQPGAGRPRSLGTIQRAAGSQL